MILVTGATGLVGSHLIIHLLDSGDQLRAIYRDPSAISKTETLFEYYGKKDLFSSIQWVNADITDMPSLELAFIDVDFVYHCAGLISFDPKDEELLRKTNIEGTANIVNLCITENIKKLCFVSSVAAIGDSTEIKGVITEEAEWNPEKYHSDYAISKYGAEMEVWRGQQEGLNIVIVNPAVIMGPVAGNWQSGSGKIFYEIANGMKYSTNGTTALVSVEDLVKIMRILQYSGVSGERFIIMSENVSLKSLSAKVAEALKVRAPYIDSPEWLIGIASKLDWFIAFLLFRKRKLSKALAIALYSRSLYSNEKIKAELNYEFENPDIAITKTADYFTADL